ncbi:MAG: glycosyltransferase [Prevotella sp.]|nr:glycosyltransferase [Prevotella sp.]
MTEKPSVTVITVCYNAASLLRRTIRSVADQQYDKIEYIIVDGGSTDETKEIIRHNAACITRWTSEPDHGIYDAMNKGVAMSTGDWVIFLNAGDTFADKDVLQKVFAEHKQADVIYGDVRRNGIVKPAEPPHNGHRMYFCHQSCLTRTECLRNFPYDTSHKMSADFKLYKTLWKNHCRFLQVHFAIADFDTTGVSSTNRSQGILDNIHVIQEVDGLIDQIRLLPRLWFVYAMCRIRNK